MTRFDKRAVCGVMVAIGVGFVLSGIQSGCDRESGLTTTPIAESSAGIVAAEWEWSWDGCYCHFHQEEPPEQAEEDYGTGWDLFWWIRYHNQPTSGDLGMQDSLACPGIDDRIQFPSCSACHPIKHDDDEHAEQDEGNPGAITDGLLIDPRYGYYVDTPDGHRIKVPTCWELWASEAQFAYETVQVGTDLF